GFRHDLVRESVYEEIADWARAALHAQAAEVLRLDGAADPEVAHLLGRGEPAVDPAIGGAFRRAGQTLLHTDPAAARSLFERALELTPDPDGALVAELVLATTWAGSPEEGERLARTHLGVDAVAVRHALAHNLLAQGRMAEAADEVTLVAGSHGAEARR